MSTTKTFTNIKAGKRHQIDATARGYYDFRTTVVPQPNKPLSYDMKVYDGLKYAVDLSKNSVRPGEINFDGTVLPYLENNKLTKTNYCFGNSGTNYDLSIYEEVYSNITKVGNVNINNDIASDFSSSNYIVITKKASNMTIYLKVTTGSNLSSSQNIVSFDGYFDLQVYNNVFGCYDWGAVTYYTLLSDITANTTYYWRIELSETDKTKKYSYSTDGVTYTEAKTFTDSGMSYNSANDFCLGIHAANKNNPFYGLIDLSKSTVSEKQTNGDFVDYKLNAITFNPTGTYESKIGIFQDYEDNGQSNTLNCFSNSNRYTVLSPNENIIYYMKHQYIDWTQPILSSDGTMGGDLFAVNSSSILRAGREAYKAFDGDTSTIDDNWHSSQGHPSWIGWYNPNPLKITRIQVQNRNSADGGSFVNTYKLSYSDDYSDWVDLLSGTSPSQENFTYWNIDITEENPHKYWRLTCLTSSGSNSDYTSIQTISITAQEYVSLKGTPDDYDEIVKYTYLGTVDIPKHNIYNVDNFYGWSNDSKSIFTKTLQLSTDIPLYNSSYKQESAITISSFADNSITLSNNEVYTRNNTLDKHVVLPNSNPGESVPPLSEWSTLNLTNSNEVVANIVSSDTEFLKYYFQSSSKNGYVKSGKNTSELLASTPSQVDAIWGNKDNYNGYTQFLHNKFFSYGAPEGMDVYVYTSNNGISHWSKHLLPISYFSLGMTYGVNKYFLIGYDAMDTVSSKTNYYIYSEDGVTYKKGVFPRKFTVSSIAASNDTVVVAGAEVDSSNPVVFVSNDGITWNEISSTLFNKISVPYVNYCKDRFIIYERLSNNYYWSKAGKDWLLGQIPSFTGIDPMMYLNGYFVAIDSASKLSAFSTDVFTWMTKSLPLTLTKDGYHHNELVGVNNEFVLSNAVMDETTYEITTEYVHMLLK